MSARWLFWLLFISLGASAQKPVVPTLYADPSEALQVYRENLTKLRQQHANVNDLPSLRFYLFGMGDRLKLIYRNGRLLNALTGNIEEQWAVSQQIIVPSEYLVHLVLTNGQIVQIREDETGVWLLQPGKRPKLIPGTRSRVNLPRFADHPFGPVLRVLHQEVLINVMHGRPLPNFLVYLKPRYRDATQIASVLQATENLSLIHDWIMAIRDPLNRNEKGIAEVDNLGEVLFLLSLVTDKTHPVVQVVLDSAQRFRKDHYIVGKTSHGNHPVFQTKWLKYGLKSLGLSDGYTIPNQSDSYSSLFWRDYKTESSADQQSNTSLHPDYPYLDWAQDHFYDEKRGPIATLDYPLSWEQNDPTAHYPGMVVLDKDLIKQKLAFPHGWHAAEMFLLLTEP